MIKGILKGILAGAAVGLVSMALYAAIIASHNKGPRCHAQLFNSGIYCEEPLGHDKRSPHINGRGYIWEPNPLPPTVQNVRRADTK